MDGIIAFNHPAENMIRIIFEDQKTDEEKIVRALVTGGVEIPGKSTPESETPHPYK
jgi:hypothetical protein